MQIKQEAVSSSANHTLAQSSSSSPSLTRSRVIRRSSNMSPKHSPKRSTPLYIKLSAELLMAPKKKFPTMRRLKMAKAVANTENEPFITAQADGSIVKTDGDTGRSTRPRSRICRDLFKAKMNEITSIRG